MLETKRIVNEVSHLAETLLHELALEMVDVEFQPESGRWILRVYMDREGGITVDDCTNVSRELGDLIEAENIIDHPYVLEISSPGLNRPLRKERDFIRSIGKMVKLKMLRPVNRRTNFAGRVTDVKEGMISLLVDDNDLVELPLKEIDKARLRYEFDN